MMSRMIYRNIWHSLSYHVFTRTNIIIRHVALMVTNQVAARRDQYPFSFIYIHTQAHTHIASDVNVTENKEANHCHHHHLTSLSLVIVVVRCLANCIDINLMVATRRHCGINYHAYARLLST
jgi:hypothetical protein